ncbi:MAG TPA: glycosyltransferase family 2 protein [Devosiaceae bacterium]|nr:glycosyltransferase family 2 protein [Devosiaceae bacterium]
MSQSIELVRILLPEFLHSEADAAAVLDAAHELGVNPVHYCVHRYGLGAEAVFARAAEWAGLAFLPSVPFDGRGSIQVRRLDSLGGIRSIRASLDGREILFLAPGFDEFIGLKAHAAAHPEFRRQTCIVPAAAIPRALSSVSTEQLLDEARGRLSRRWPFASAGLDLGRRDRVIFIGAMTLLVASTALSACSSDLCGPAVAGVLLLAPALFRLGAVATRPAKESQLPPLSDAELPIYSVLIPLRDEAHMVPLLRRAMTALHYPPEKLDIKFVVEGRSEATVSAVRDLLADPRFELVEVPDARPFTKPKALNYALPFVRGAHVVVYDAEDIPDPDQLLLAAAAFAGDPGVDCLQAELLVDNARENVLTGLFAGEYAGQFGPLMAALARHGLPLPLGGTSNHFRTAALRELGGWDAFNVTEDADLGVRLARLRYRTAMLQSRTYEEAPISIDAWMRQRTRWMKGWMQTFIVHNRRPLTLFRDMGWRNFLAFEIYVGSLIVSPLLHATFLFSLLAAPCLGVRTLFGSNGAGLALALAVLVLGYGGAFAAVFAGLLRLGQRRLLAVQLLLPLYWMLQAVATIRAGHELLVRPHFWAKTKHGLTKLERSVSSARKPEGPATMAESPPVHQRLERQDL